MMIGGIFFYIAVGIVFILASVVLILLFLSHKKERIRLMLSYKLFLVRVPKPQREENLSIEDGLNLSEQFLSLISSIKSAVSIESAISNIGEEINFYVSVPEKYVSSMSRSIEGIFKDAVVTEVGDYNIFHNTGYSAGLYLKQDSHYSLPIRTYLETMTDTFSPILNGLSNINSIGEGVAIQVIAQKAPDSYKKNIISIINDLKKGESLKEVYSKHSVNLENVIKFFSSKENSEDDKDKKPVTIDDKTIALLEEKISKPLLQVNYRILVSSSNKFRTDSILESMLGGFSQFESPMRNGIKTQKAKNIQDFSYEFSFRKFNDKESMILNTQELTSLFHFPFSSTLAPKINWLTSIESSPPLNMPTSGTKIGESNYRGKHIPVYILEKDRLRHVYIIGQTGTGKSALLQNMVLDDIKKGKGVAVMDPHGDLVEKIAGLIPDNRLDDVIVFDPAYTKKAIGLNMLEYDFNRPEEKTFIVNEMQEIFRKIFPDSGDALGPMFQQYMRNALLLLLEDMPNEPATLVEVPRVFTDEDYRKRKLDRISNPVVVDFWTKEAVKAGGEASLKNITPYITSKFNVFIANEYVRPIIGQAKSSINFRSMMDNKKIFLANMSKGRVGSTNAGLLGMIITGKILMSALSRADIREDKRVDFNLYIDEFQNFTTESIPTMLSEARKYHLSLTVAHQFIAQLEEKTREAVFGSVGTIISFRVGFSDAEILENQFKPIFSSQDLINLDNFNAYAKLLINGETTNPFNIKTIAPLTSDEDRFNTVMEMSFAKYGKNRDEIDKEIMYRLRD